MANWWDGIAQQLSRAGNAAQNVFGGGVSTDGTKYDMWGNETDLTYANNPRAKAAYEAERRNGTYVPGSAADAENERVARDRADRWVDDPFAAVTGPISDFLTNNPIGQAIAPTVANGAGVKIRPGSNPSVPNAPSGPTVTPHVGMAAPTTAANPDYDIDGIVDRAVGAEKAKQPGLAAPTTGTYFYNNNPVSKAEYDRLMGYDPNKGKVDKAGWNSKAQSPPTPNTSRLSDGTEYYTSVVNGQTIFTVVKSPSNPAAAGKQMDNSNFNKLLSGKSFTPIAGGLVAGTGAGANVPSNAGAPSPLTSGQNPTASATGTAPQEWWKDPNILSAISAGIGGATSLGAGDAIAKAQTEAANLQKQSTDDVLKMLKDQYNQQRTDQQPWREAGAGALTELTNFDTNNPAFSFSMDGPNADPSYTFRLNEGMKALQNSAAGRGGLLSGNTLKAISNYGQESASQEYQNAFNRYNTERTSKLNRLQSLAGVGQTAVGQTQQAGQNYMSGAGSMITGGANALAGGITGSADARASGYTGASNALIGAIGNYQSHNFLNNILGGR